MKSGFFLSALAVLLAGLAHGGNVCVWTGAAGDGKWNTPGNWEGNVVPVNYNKDTVIVSSAGIEPGDDGVAEMSNNIPGSMYVDQLQIAADSGPLRITGNRLGLSLYKGITAAGYVLTVDKAGIACLAAGSPVEIATDIASTGERAIYLAERADLTLSGKLVDGNGSPSQKVYFYKYGPTSSRFALTGEIAYSGYTYGDYTNVAFYAYGGTNVIGGAACPANTEVRFGGSSSTVVFAGGEVPYGSKIVIRDTGASGPFDLVCQGASVINGSIEIRSAINSLKLRYKADCTYNEPFGSSAAITYVSFYGENDSDVTFAQGLNVPSVDMVLLYMNGGSLTFDGPLRTVRAITDDTELSTSTLRFNAAGNSVSSIYARYFNVVCGADNAFDERTQWTWGYASDNDRGVYDLQGHDQVLDRFSTTASDTKKGRLLTSALPATLTLHSQADCTPKARLSGPITLVYAPMGDYTHVVDDISYLSTGDLIVSKGTFVMSGTATYPDAASIVVRDGAVFDDGSSAEVSLAHVGKIVVEEGGTFRISTYERPFENKVPLIEIETGAVLGFSSVVSGESLPIKMNGAFVPAGRYQPTDGGDETATRVSWLESGTGVISVNEGEARWTEAVDGDWNDDSKWTTRPGETVAATIDVDGNFAVRIDETGVVQTNLTVVNDRGTTTLAVSNDLSFVDGATVSLGRGARMEIGTGGRVEYQNGSSESTQAAETKISVADGAELAISGGAFVANNMVGRIGVASSDAQTPSRVVVRDGAFSFLGKSVGTAESSCLLVGENGIFEATNATVSLILPGTANEPAVRQLGGTMRFTGASSVLMGGNWCTYLGSGLTYIGGDTDFRTTHDAAPAYLRFMTASTVAGITNHIVIADHAVFGGDNDAVSEDNLAMTVFGYCNKGNLTRVDYCSDACSKFGMLILGATYGYAEMNVSSGTVMSGSSGLTVGGFAFVNNIADADVVGVLRVKGGNVVAKASGFGGTKNRVYAFVVGGGWYDVKSATTHNLYTGRIDLESGTVSNLFGSVILGAGCAKGSVVQTGGEFVNVAQTDAKNRPRPMILGWLGGTGEYVLSNGVARVTDPEVDVYVGGVPTNATPYCLDAGRPSSADPATGLLSLEGGEMAVAGRVVLSADGDGTLSVGPSGKLTAGSLVFSNGTYQATSAVVHFRCGPSGCGSVNVGDLVVREGATLDVDLGDYDCSKSLRLIGATNVTGRFDAANVTIRGSEAQLGKMRLVQDASGVRLVAKRGFIVIVR